MPGLDPGIHVFGNSGKVSRGWPGHRRAEATPSFRRLCPAMTKRVRRPAILSRRRALLIARLPSRIMVNPLTPVARRCVMLRWVELALRTELAFSRMRRRATSIAAATLAASFMLVPGSVSAEGLFDMFFGGGQKTAGAASPGTGEFLCRSVRPQSAASTARPGAARRRLRTRLLCAKLRRQVFSADHARQRHAGSDVPGVLSRQHHQSVLRQQYRQRVGQQWRALRRQ